VLHLFASYCSHLHSATIFCIVLQLCVNLGRRGIVREKGEGWRYEFKGGGGVNAFEGRGGEEGKYSKNTNI